MKHCYQLFVLIAIFPLLSLKMKAQAPNITGVTPLATVVEQYGKFEARISLTAAYTNPYDYDNIHISAVFTGPNGQSKRWMAFLCRNFS